MTKARYKTALCRAYSDGVINSKQLHELADRFDRLLPWWRIDSDGWPIETYKGNPFKSAVRIAMQNVRKLIRKQR